MRKKTANLFVKMTAKSPLLFLGLILLSVVIILYITLTTEVDVIQTYDAKVEGNTLMISQVNRQNLSKLYVYENRERAVYCLEPEEGDIDWDGTGMLVSLEEPLFEPETDFVKVDIPVRKISLFRRVFLQGGKNE